MIGHYHPHYHRLQMERWRVRTVPYIPSVLVFSLLDWDSDYDLDLDWNGFCCSQTCPFRKCLVQTHNSLLVVAAAVK